MHTNLIPWATSDLPPDWLTSLQQQASLDGRECVVGGLVADRAGRIFVQKRSPHRRLLPGCWDIVGGHVEPGETLRNGLAREILEETGWRLSRITTAVAIIDWSTEHDGRVVLKREFDFLVSVDGDLDDPQIERDKFTEYRWIGPADIERLNENRHAGDTLIHDLVRTALDLTHGGQDRSIAEG